MEINFIDELLKEAEEKEQKLSMEYADLMLIEISQLEKQIQTNFEQAAREREIIKNWSLKINSKLASRIEFLSKKLEVFIKETGEKTINLPNGILKNHKKPDRVEVEDLEIRGIVNQKVLEGFLTKPVCLIDIDLLHDALL